MSKGYLFGEVEVTDPAGYDEYRKLVGATVDAFGGRFLVRGGDPVRLEGDRPLHRFVVLEFDSPERAREWYYSKQYQDVLPLRQGAARSHVSLLNGASPT